MIEFLKSIPDAATNPWAFVAYAVAAILFLLAGQQLRKVQLLSSKIKDIPNGERLKALQIAANTVLPTEISPEQWIRNNRLKWTALLLGSFLIAIIAVATIALLNPTKQDMNEVKKTVKDTGGQTQEIVKDEGRETREAISDSTGKIVKTVEDTALAELETMFPFAVRVEITVDSTIMHLDGSPKQRLVSYDNNLKPMKLRWGDRFHYFAYSEKEDIEIPSSAVFLEVISKAKRTTLPLRLDLYSEQEIRIPGSSPREMDAYIINKDGVKDVGLKITVYSSDRERGREKFLEALKNTSLNNAARRTYFQVNGDGVRLRNSSSLSSPILRSISKETYVKVKERTTDNEWCQIRLPEGREGWMKCSFLEPIVPN